MSMRNANRYMSLVVVLALVALAVTGCGSGTATGGGAKAAVTLTIGIGAPLTDGAVPQGKGMVRGTNRAVNQANATQEVKDLGLTIATVEGDDKGDPTTGGNVATQFVSNPSLVGVMGTLNSGVTRVEVKIYNQANVVQVSPANTADDLTKMGMANFFRVCTVDSVQGPVSADYAFKDGGKILGRDKTSDKEKDFKSLVSKIKSRGADIVYYGGLYNSGALLSKQLKEGGLKVPLMGGDGCYDPEFIKLAGAANAIG